MDSRLSRRKLLRIGLGAVGGLAACSSMSTASFEAPEPDVGNNRDTLKRAIKPGGTLPVATIEGIMQTTGVVSDGVLSITLERKDLSVIGPHGSPFHAPFALNHEFFFQSLENGEVFMNAEFTFLPSELDVTLDSILNSPLELMAQHQHYIGEKPQTFHYHFRGRGDAAAIAHAVIEVVKATATPLPQAAAENPQTPLPWSLLGDILGGKARVESKGVVGVMITRPEQFVEAGVLLRSNMNVLHKIAFEPANDSGSLALCGADYALRSGEINPALQRSRRHGFEVHCLYNQQTDICPSLFFSHHLKSGDPVQLAHEVRDVLDAIGTTRAWDECMPVSGDRTS